MTRQLLIERHRRNPLLRLLVEIQRQLKRFEDAIGSGEDGKYRMETSLRGAQTVEKLATTVDNTSPG